jgi:hypothetical protein
MSSTGPYSPGRANATDDGWRRGFADPDLEDDAPPARRPTPDRDGAPGPGAFSGVDDSGVITVAVDRAGLVADVTVARNWREVITPPELGNALLTAADNAILGLVADEVERMDLDSMVLQVPTAPPVPAARNDSTLTEMVDLLNRAGRDLETYSGHLEAVLNTTATATGPNGRVTVGLARGRVVEVTADPRWASHVRYTEIRAEALGAFRAAARRLGDTDITIIQKPASLVRLQELVELLARGTR